MPFKPLLLFEVLAAHGVEYVTIGGMAATLWGSPLTTGDVDLCPATSAENLDRLAAALRALDARVYSVSEREGIPFACDGPGLAGARVWSLVTAAGRVDLAFEPAGTGGYDDLARAAVLVELGDVTAPVAALADVIRSKEAAGRERDRAALPTLRLLQEVIDRSEGRP